MRFVIVSDSLTSATGFAKQTRLMAFELFKRGHEVIVVGRANKEWHNQDISQGPIEWALEREAFNTPKAVETLLYEAKPDNILFFRNAGYLDTFKNIKAISDFKTLFWYADENEDPKVSDSSQTDLYPDRSLLPISNAVAQCIKSQKIACVMHHAIDFSSLPSNVNRELLRKKWGYKLNHTISTDDLLLICAERNDVRKNWDATYALVAEIKAKMPLRKVRLLQLTSQARKDPYFDLSLCRKFYDIEDDVIDLATEKDAYSDLDVCELLQLSDLRISCSGSEGFGLLSLEAAALKVPQVCIKLKALTEFLGEDNPSLVEPYRLAMYPKDEFYYANKAYAIPDINRMSDRAIEMLENEKLREESVNHAFRTSYTVCNSDKIIEQYLKLVGGQA